MIQTGIESKIKIQDIVSNQLPEFILDESPKTVDFLKQYYISQEYQGGPVDLSDNLDEYLKLDNLKPEVVVDSTLLTSDVTSSDNIINVSSTRGFPSQYGLLKIDNEIITYTGLTTNTFTGCIRGFSGITDYNEDLTEENLLFETSNAESHKLNSSIQNLSSLFLKEFYKKFKTTFAPGFEKISLVDEIDVGNFIKNAKDFYSSKGTDEAIKILFKVVFGETPSVINLEDYLLKPSSANYVRREIVVAEAITGEPMNIVGETIVKSNDENTTASVSSVEPFTRKGKTYFKIQLYVSNDGRSSIEGDFVITPNTKLTENASVGDSILTVDSTVSFPESGTLISGTNTISYTDKSINQFFGCTGINSEITKTSNIRSNETYFSYEGGDITKKVEIILLGVITNLKEQNKNFIVSENDLVGIKNVGDKIEDNGSNWKEIFANSFIYNTSATYQVTNNDTTPELGSTINRSSLKVGDEVEVVQRDSIPEVIVPTNNPIYVRTIDKNTNTLDLQNAINSETQTSIFQKETSTKYNIRRKLNKVQKSGFKFDNNSLLSDVLNLYVDKDEYAYVASNSFPSNINNNFKDSSDKPIKNYRLNIDTNIKTVSIESTDSLKDKNNGVFNTIKVIDDIVPFLTDDKIFYSSEGEPLVGLTTGNYFVKKTKNDEFKLYGSQSLIKSGNNLTFQIPSSGIGSHTFVLDSQKDSELGIQKLLRKFPLGKNIEQDPGDVTLPGSTGMLINGVEISNYKSTDIIHFGPIEDVNILNGGENYDVINPPIVEVSSGIGNTALIQPVVSGKFEKIYVDSQKYDIDKIGSIEISGGNGSGAVIDPVLILKPRDVFFSAKNFSIGGGVNQTTDKIVFLEDHNFVNGQEISYNSLGNNPIKIGTLSDNADLPDDSTYFVEVVNNKTIKLYFDLDDQQLGINPVGIFTGSSGTHRFSTSSSSKTIDYIQIISGGEGYTNRKLIVKPVGISTIEDTITFKNHGFSSGELVEYDYQTSEISGITTTNQFYILKLDNDSFRLCNAGVGGTITSNYERGDYEKFSSTGSGEQYFKYPDISVSIKYTSAGIGSTTQTDEELVITPVIKGKIIDAYVYESGTGYGSTVLNYEDKPVITIKNGKSAQLTPTVIDGRLTNVTISYSGSEYFSIPDLVVSGSGTGAELRAIVNADGQIVEVKVVNAGSNYSSTDTKIKVVSSGKNALIDPQIRKLNINNNVSRFTTGEVVLKGKDKLQYSVSKYFEGLRNAFLEKSSAESGIIGWAYDGNPIYGPTGYTNPETRTGLKNLESGYVIDTSSVIDRPSGFEDGFFVEDYKFDGSGDLDEYNGRYERNKEYPNGVYAYHATLDSSGNSSFPYFIGNKYRSKLISNSDLNQSFDFNNSNLLRNTLPYKVSENNADYDFINETSDILEQKIKVLSVISGPIESVDIQNSGSNYNVGDKLIFNESGTSGSGLNVRVKSVKGKDIVDLVTNSTSNLDSIFTWKSSEEVKVSILPNHNLSNSDTVIISGFSTNLSSLNGTHKITVPSYSNGVCISTISASATAGVTTEIYVTPIPEQIAVGSSVGIGTEILRVLGIFKNENILRIERGVVGLSHTAGTPVSFLPDSFTILKSVDKFDSKLDNEVFFNPKESVGVSTISGVGYSTSFIFGNTIVNRDIPSRSISIDNHPFTTNQRVGFNTNGSNTIGVSTSGLTSDEVSLTSFSNLFVINKNPNLIGLKTTINGEELFFHGNGDDNDGYSLSTNNTKILGDVEKNVVTVSISTASLPHGLKDNDTITLDVQPNLSVGLGTTTSVSVLYNSDINNIIVNPIGFNSTGINTNTNQISIVGHGLKTGDKVFYQNGPIPEDVYFVYKISDNKFNLCETSFDVKQIPPTIVSFASTGSSDQIISLINPQLNPIKNNNLVFDLTDSSLVDYSLKIYTDSQFKNEFVSSGSTNTFNISGIGTVGVSTNASLTLKYDSQIPKELYYTLEKDGVILNADVDVQNNSLISYEESIYNNTYTVSGVGTTTFNLNIGKKPEKLSYASTECSVLEYSTTAIGATGPVKSLNVLSFGAEYKKLPVLESTNSTLGTDLIVNVKSNLVGSIKESKILNSKFTYSPDKTLRPQAIISPTVEIKNSSTLKDISVIRGGNGYTTPPKLILINPISRNLIDSGLVELKLSGSAVSSAKVVVPPKGLPDDSVDIFTIDNTNGIAVERVESVTDTSFNCILSTPTGIGNTFTVVPFVVGDEVFIEGIQKISTDGDGFNSEDYGYRFFKVTNYDDSGIDNTVTIDVSGLTTDTGTPKTIQDFSGIIINKNDYPTFKATQKQSEFFVGERLSSNGIIRNLKVIESNGNQLKVFGSYRISVGEVFRGIESDNIATIDKLSFNEGIFDVSFSQLKDIGWNTEIGKLSEDYQVISDNDYYQNLSYSVKSSVSYKKQQPIVENLVHTSGLKNFADTEISKSSNAGLTKSDDGFTVIYDIIDEKRADTINNFDNVIDEDIVNSKSKLLKFKTKDLTNYVELKNLNVLKIDNIDNQFSNFEGGITEFLSIDEIVATRYEKYLFRITSEDKTEYQLTDLTILSDGINSVIVENESLYNSDSPYGSFDLVENEFQETFLRFIPVDSFNTNYDLKVLNQSFISNDIGTGTQSIGFIDLIGSVDATVDESSVGIGTTTIISLDSNNFNSFYVDAQVTDTVTKKANYVKLYVVGFGTESYISDYFIDGDLKSLSANQIGIFTSKLDSNSGILSLDYENISSNTIKIRTNTVGFGTTTSGTGTFRFKSNDQTDGQERSIIYNSNYNSTVSLASTVINTLDKTLFDASKSIVQVSAGSTKALHQVLLLFDGTDVYTQQLPFLSATPVTFDDSTGIGTFGGEVSGNDILLKFYPYDQNQQVDIEIFNQSLYRDLDIVNEYNNLEYGPVSQRVDEKFYNAINLDRINKKNFKLTSNFAPIFSKTFNPNSTSLDATTGIFTIEDHFFMTGEELIYTPNSTVIGIGTSAMMMNTTDVLPTTVYAIKINEDTFKVATSTSNAISGIGTTFTSLGEGNAHRFTMKEKNSKCIITIDELVQYPIAFTKISHTLSGNAEVGASLGISTSFVSLSGISTVNIQDVLLIDEEYLGIVNVGFGTTNLGPITNSGNIPLVEVERGFVGSSATTHNDGSTARIYKGAFNIVDDEIHFAEAPRGNPQIDKTKFNLDYEQSSFTGRVFLKSNYDSNKVYDDISDEFTGIGRTFALTVEGSNSVGIGTSGGNGLIFINNIYQSPKTANNPLQFNYEITEDSNSGISTVEFSGIARPDNVSEIFTSEVDINENETPRGGIIVSYGSTPGLGFAPLVGASVTAVVDSSDGSIVSVGLGTTDNLGSGYNGLVSIGISVFEAEHNGTTATITATANVGAGGSLTFNVDAGGTGYTNPQIFVSDPSYENLPIVGVSRLGVGATTDTGIGLLLDLEVGGSSTTGIGSTYFEVKEFKISRSGYSFQRGDVFKPVGLVTDSNLSSPLSDFTLNVIETYSDNFAAWEFGELDYIDSIEQLQDGERTRFPLRYNQELIGFEFEEGSALQKNINNVLVIFINGVIQEPEINFIFNGGTTVAFTTAPLESDEVEIYFFKGVRGSDSKVVSNIAPSIETGDILQVLSNNSIPNTITQNERVTYNIVSSDTVETDRYSGPGVDGTNFKPVSWTKQKISRKVNGEFVNKSRNILEPLIFPTAKIIKDVSTTDNQIFVDSIELFEYEDGNFAPNNSQFNDKPQSGFGALIVEDTNPVSAAFTCSIDGNGSVTGITTENPGFGYLSNQTTIELKFVGIGTTATATASVTNGVVTGTTITNPGSGYTVAPTIFAETPDLNIERITGFNEITGFSGIMTGITTTTGIGGNPLALQFTIQDTSPVPFVGISTGYPIYIYDTKIGSGVTSIDSSDSEVVAIGTTFLDNVYYISDWSNISQTGIITCNVKSDSNIIGIGTTGDTSNPVGRYSWGRLNSTAGLTRSSNPISIGVSGNIVSGLSTYPTIQRKNFGIRQTGALPKFVS